MLTLTETAAAVLTDSRSQQGIPEDTMLRVSAEGPDQQSLSLGFVEEPAPGDQTGTAHGLDICVAPEVAEVLDDAQIDVQTIGDDAQLVIVPAG